MDAVNMIMVMIAIIASLSGASSPAKSQTVKIEWGTADTVIYNNQTLAIWIRVWNTKDSGVEVIPYPNEAYQIWAKSLDTSYMLGSWLDGDNAYPANSSVLSIIKIDAFGVTNGIKKRCPAKLVLRTSSPFQIVDSEKTTILAPPENLDLDKWFAVANDLRKNSLIQNHSRIANSSSGLSGSGGWGNSLLHEKCGVLKHWLDSLRQKHTHLGLLSGNAERTLNLYFCQQDNVFADISAVNWPEIRGVSRCESLKKMRSPLARSKCQESKLAFNKMIADLAGLQKQLPRDKYHRLKFQSTRGVVYLDRTSWYDNESGRIP